MDEVSEIKARLPIEELVRSYTQLTKKGRNFVGLCPFHNDTHPSFLVSPDKGISYCFPCQKGGDIFSFYQQIEGVDFRQALKDLAEKTGVVLKDNPKDVVHKDEKDRLRDCLEEACVLFQRQLQKSDATLSYLASRGLTPAEIQEEGLGLAPDSFDFTYQHLLKAGFSRKEITMAGLAIQKDLNDDKMYDRFRYRLMFPIRDSQARIIGFGGRALGNDDAKYLNSPDTVLYRKSSVLYGIDRAAKAVRELKRVYLVEGYFDVLACRRAGLLNVVATCGTALTEEHAKILKRTADRLVLCMDQDTAGKNAADRAFILAAKEGLEVEGIVLPEKDPADMAVSDLEMLRTLLASAKPFLQIVLHESIKRDLSQPAERRDVLERVLPMIDAITSATEREFAFKETAHALGTTDTSLREDIRHLARHAPPKENLPAAIQYTSAEITLALFILYPRTLPYLQSLIEPDQPFAQKVYSQLKHISHTSMIDINTLKLEPTERERLQILVLFCEQHGMSEWNDAIAQKEVQRNCQNCNREFIRRKQEAITKELLLAKKAGDTGREMLLQNQYLEVLKLAKIAK